MTRATIGCALALVAALVAPVPAVAGGYAFKAEVLDLRALGNDEYRMVFRPMGDVFTSDHAPPAALVLHLRHNEDATRDVSKDLVSRENSCRRSSC